MNKLYLLLKAVFFSFLGNPIRRYEARHSLLQSFAVRWGFRLYNRNLAWLNDSDYKEVWRQFPENDDTIHERRFNLLNLARSMRRVPGDIVECGVFRGAGSYLMLSAQLGLDKHLFGFDSFEGLSMPCEHDRVETEYTFRWKQHDMTVGEAIASRNLSSFGERVTLLKGWIPDRFYEVAERRFCLVHIDVDLYEPTRDAARYFYPLLNAGGMIICDDYGSEACPGAKRAMDEVAEEFDNCVVHLTTGQGLIFKV